MANGSMGDGSTENFALTPPQAIEAEACVLGSMMLDPTSVDIVLQIITAENFFRPAHQLIFGAIVEMRNSGSPIDLVLLKDEFTKRNQLERIGGVEYLAALVEGLPSSANAEYYAQIVRNKAVLRNLISACGQISRDAYSRSATTEQIVQEAEKYIYRITSEHVGKEAVYLDSLLADVFEQIEKGQGKVITGAACGFCRLDEMTRGFQNGEMIVIAARPSMGKTSLLLNMMGHMAVIENLPVAIFSLEMSQKQLVPRVLASYARCDIRRMSTGRISDEECSVLKNAAGDLHSGAKIVIDDSPELTITQIRAKARRMKLRDDIQCVFIDYLQLIRSTGRAENRQVQVAEISRGIKAMARELDIPVVTAAQLNRAPADRPNHRPQMSNLRESGAIEQDADVVMLLHDEDYYHRNEQGYMPTGIRELIIAKQRNGPIGIVPLIFLPECTRFESAADEWN